jgi:hypothetical protein
MAHPNRRVQGHWTWPCHSIVSGKRPVAKPTQSVAVLFGQKLGPDPHGLGWVVGVDTDRLGVLGRGEGAGRSWLVGVRGSLCHRPTKVLELGGVGDGGGELEVLATAGVRLLEGAVDCDDAVWPQHL